MPSGAKVLSEPNEEPNEDIKDSSHDTATNEAAERVPEVPAWCLFRYRFHMNKGYSVFARSGRPVWYIKYVSAETGDWKPEATGFRLDDPSSKRKALRLAERKAGEFKQTGLPRRAEAWSNWAKDFLELRYRNSPLTLKRYLGAWSWLALYLKDNQVHGPINLTYSHVLGFINWRRNQKKHSGKLVSLNTAICDIKVLSILYREALRRGYTTQINPCEKIGITRDPPKEKVPLNDQEIALIRKAVAEKESSLPLNKRWMTISFEIALHQGCRLTETQVPLDRIDEDAGTILFMGKGRNGQKKPIMTSLHPALKPMIKELRQLGVQSTCELPSMAAKIWWSLRKEIGISHTTFHSTRVTVITRFGQQGVPEAQAMAYVGHSSRAVHAIYRKLKPVDLGSCHAALSF